MNLNKYTRIIKQANIKIKEQATWQNKLLCAYWEKEALKHEMNKYEAQAKYGCDLEPWEYITEEELDELAAIEAEIKAKVAAAIKDDAPAIHVIKTTRKHHNWIKKEYFA